MKDKASQVVTISSALLFGALIGAGVGILTAPQSGEETRTLLREKSIEMKGKATDVVIDTRDRAERALDELALSIKERIPVLKNNGEPIVEETVN